MNKGEVVKSALLVSALFMTACSHNEPKVHEQAMLKKELVHKQVRLEKEVEVNVNLNEEEKVLALTELSTQEENWVPLKIEDEVEWNAKELLGRKYVWGATGPVNYDCSGFTQKIYGDLGIKLPRVSRNQAEYGKLVRFDELQKGDLVFFATKRRKPGLVTHVGIYLGNGDFIHASSGAKKVVICNFEKHCFYKRKFLWARRVIQDKSHVASNVQTADKSAI